MAAQPQPDEPRRVEPFGNILATLQKGRTHAELGRALVALTEAVVATGKAGTLTLTLKISPSKQFGMVELEDKVTAKPPEPERYASLFYVADDHNLTRSDPNQLELPVGPRAVANDEGTATR